MAQYLKDYRKNDYQNQDNKLKIKKPSRFLTVLALAISFCLPYYLVTTFSNHQKSTYTRHSLTLPQLHLNGKTLVNESNGDDDWKIIKTRAGDTLGKIFNQIGLSAQELHAVLQNNPHAKVLTQLKPNQQIQFQIKNKELKKMILPFTNTQFVVVYKEGNAYKTKLNTKKMNSHSHYVTATVTGSLFGTAKRLGIPYKLINQMTEIFNWQIDFARDIREGDQFTIIYKAHYIEDKLVGTGDIVAVSFNNKGKLYQAIRHTNSSGLTDYYTPAGLSLRKAFSRYPLKFSHISSTFSSSRYHPLLRYRRAHKGIDLAASIGTPIHTTADGIISFIGRDNGYGNVIKINHYKVYSTVYGHMLRFQKGLSRGSRVKRGQVIGYVGQTGLATGPHCHYEFHINHVPRNPSTIDLPHGDPVPAKEMAAFRANSSTLLAHLKLFEEANLASSKKKSTDLG